MIPAAVSIASPVDCYVIMLQVMTGRHSQHPHPQAGKSLDGFAIAMSLACILHCLLLPVLIVVFPILGSTILADESFHGLLLVLIIPTSSLALYLGCRQHGDGLVLWLGMAGLAILALAAGLGISVLGVTGEKVLTALGGTLLAAAHVLNFRRCRARNCEERAASAAVNAVV